MNSHSPSIIKEIRLFPDFINFLVSRARIHPTAIAPGMEMVHPCASWPLQMSMKVWTLSFIFRLENPYLETVRRLFLTVCINPDSLRARGILLKETTLPDDDVFKDMLAFGVFLSDKARDRSG